MRLVGTSETRDSVIALAEAPRVHATWEVVGEQVTTRRDGLVSQATWLLNLGEGIRFALLLDYFPASLGKRSSTFSVGEQLTAELVFYPARQPLRAVIAQRQPAEDNSADAEKGWPSATASPMAAYREVLKQAPWMGEVPLLLPDGRIAQSGSSYWWQSEDKSISLPLSSKPDKHIAGLAMQQTAALWDGISLTLLSGQSNWGRWSYDS